MGNSKGEILKSMMRQPESAKLIKEALGSSVGSTSRARAKKMFSIMDKLHTSYDGSGGPGMMYDQMSNGMNPAPEMDPVHIPTDNPKNMVIFHKLPTPKIKYGASMASSYKPRAGFFDGSGGPGVNVNDDNNGGTVDDGMGGPFSDLFSPITAPFQSLVSQFSAPIGQTSSPSTPSTTSTPFYPTPNGQPISSPSTLPPPPTSTTPTSYSNLSSKVGNPPLNYSPVPQSSFSSYINSSPAPTPYIPPAIARTPLYPTPTGQPVPSNSPANISHNNSSASTQSGTTGPSSYSNLNNNQSANSMDPVAAATAAIVANESSGNYQAISKVIPSGANAGHQSYGKYQVLDTHIADWTKQATGTAMTKEQFLASPAAQDAVAKMQIGQLWKTYGNIQDVASVWFTGKPAAQSAGLVDQTTGTTSEKYIQDAVNTFNKYTGGNAGSPSSNSPTAANMLSPSTGLPYTGLSASAATAAGNSTGAGMFALNQLLDPNNPVTHGKTMQEMAADNQKTLWDKYNIGGLQQEDLRLQEEGALLPKNVTAYITARDQYLTQTDQNISNFINDSMQHTDMSNPNNAAKTNAQLNYLYTLRGRQNQSYIGYLNDAVTQHQAELTHVDNMYNTALTAYQTDLQNENSITQGTYQMYASALSDMYTAVDGAPMKQLQLNAYNQQILDAHATAVSDALKNNEQNGFIVQAPKLKNIVWDGTYVLPGVDLVKTINDESVLDPTITPTNIIQTYTVGVNNYLNAPNDPTPTNGTGSGITTSTKTKYAEDAITQFAHLAINGANNPNTVLLAQQSANDIAAKLGAMKGGEYTSTAPALMQAVKTLAPKGWFTNGKAPDEKTFINTVTSLTQSPLDASIAKAIYSVFQKYVADGGSADGAVNALLYQTSSTNNRATPVPFTADEFAHNLGNIYAQDVVTKAFATQ